MTLQTSVRRNGMFRRAFCAAGLLVLALNVFIALAASYDCDKLKSNRCSMSNSLDSFETCIATQYSVSELLQCANQTSASTFDDITANFNGDSQSVEPLNILLKVLSIQRVMTTH